MVGRNISKTSGIGKFSPSCDLMQVPAPLRKMDHPPLCYSRATKNNSK